MKPKSSTTQRAPRSVVPLVVFVVMAVVILVGHRVLLIGAFPGNPLIGLSIWYGLMLGFSGFLVTIAVLASRIWIKSLLLASLVAAGLLASEWLFVAGYTFREIVREGEIARLFVFPALLLMAGLPLVVVRTLFGWRLVRGSDHPVMARHLVVEDLMLSTAAVAAIALMATMPFMLSGSRANTQLAALSISVLTLFLVGLIGVLPMVLWTFTYRGPQRWCGIWIFNGVLLALVAVFVIVTNGRLADDFWMTYGVVFLTAALLQQLGFLSLVWSGYDMRRARLVAAGDDDETTRRELRLATVQRRIWVGVWMGLAAIASLSTSWVLSSRQATLRNNLASQQSLQAAGGTIELFGYDPVKLQLGKQAVSSDLSEYVKWDKIETLDLSHAPLSDTALSQLRLFPNLLHLDLSHTDLNDSQLIALAMVPRLQSLSVAHTRLTIEGIKKLLSNTLIINLDVSGLALTDDDLAEFSSALSNRPINRRLWRLTVQDNQVTDVGLAHLQGLVKNKLDLAGNRIDGSGLKQMSIEHLGLERTPFADSEFKSIVQELDGKSLSLGSAALTDSCLPTLASIKLIPTLELHDGAITDRGLSLVALNNLNSLVLRGNQFTGECFLNWKPTLQKLDMSRSGLNDTTVTHLRGIRTSLLNLSHTALTDAALPTLATCLFTELDLTGTQVTAEGLCKTQFPSMARLYLGLGDFTEAEMEQILKSLPAGFNQRKNW